MPFADNYFDCITIAFGLRNVTDKGGAGVDVPGTETRRSPLRARSFPSPLYQPLEKLYDFYSFNILPRMGQFIANDRDSYQYLAESIRRIPTRKP